MQKNDHLTVGHEGLHHYDIHPKAGDHYTGVVAPGANDIPHWDNSSISWFGKGLPKNHDHLRQRLEQHFETPLKTDLGDEFVFGSLVGLDIRDHRENKNIHGNRHKDRQANGIDERSGNGPNRNSDKATAKKGAVHAGSLADNWDFRKSSSVVNGPPIHRYDSTYPVQRAPKWELGQPGKYVVDRSGNTHVWGVNDRDEPHHGTVIPGNNQRSTGYIHPSGFVSPFVGTEDISHVHPGLTMGDYGDITF